MTLLRESNILKVILTHDVDWPPSGPGIDHILARRERFDEEVISRVVKEGYNPYFNIPELMDIEEKYGVKSTFFFRPRYDDDSSIDAYKDVIKELVKNGWEIGAHVNDLSSLSSVKWSKDIIENIAGIAIYGSRVHYLNVKLDDLPLIEMAGFKYDSSITFNKYAIDVRNMGYFKVRKLTVFPVTIMDAYLFTYMNVSDEGIIDVVNRAVNLAVEKEFMTILWHDCSLKMKRGRMYKSVIELLTSREDLDILRGIDAYNLVRGRGA